MIEAGAVVFPGDGRSKFHELRFGEVFAQASEQRIGNFDRSASHGVGVFEHEAFECGEVEVSLIVGQIGDLIGSNAVRSAHGRANVDSKRASDQRRDAKLGQSFQLVVDEMAAHL
jgi:hypothetical protein